MFSGTYTLADKRASLVQSVQLLQLSYYVILCCVEVAICQPFYTNKLI